MTHDLDTEERYRPDPAMVEQQQALAQMMAVLQNVQPSVSSALLQQQSMNYAMMSRYWCPPVPWYARWWSPW
jgi:hypothetical protein